MTVAPDDDDPPETGAVYISPPAPLIPVVLLLVVVPVVVMLPGAVIPTNPLGDVVVAGCSCPPGSDSGWAICALLLGVGVGVGAVYVVLLVVTPVCVVMPAVDELDDDDGTIATVAPTCATGATLGWTNIAPTFAAAALLGIALLVVDNDGTPSKDAIDAAAVDATFAAVIPSCITESAAEVDTFSCAGLCAALVLVTSICCWILDEETASGKVSTAVDRFVDSATCLSHTLRSSAIILRV